MDTRPPETIVNITLCLIHQANYLIDQQLGRLEKDFPENGGLRERMTQARLAHRSQPQHRRWQRIGGGKSDSAQNE